MRTEGVEWSCSEVEGVVDVAALHPRAVHALASAVQWDRGVKPWKRDQASPKHSLSVAAVGQRDGAPNPADAQFELFHPSYPGSLQRAPHSSP